MIKVEQYNRLKSLLLDAVVSTCKLWSNGGKVDLMIEGLLAVTVDKQVVLVNMRESINPSDQRQSFSGDQLPPELNLQGTSDDIMHNLSYAFCPFLTRDECDKTTFEEMPAMGGQNNVTTRNVPLDGVEEASKLKSSQSELEDSLLKGSLDYSGLSLSDVSATMERFGVAFDDNPSTLFANVDFDDIISKQSKGLQQNLLLNDDNVDLSFKNQNRLEMLDRTGSSDANENFGSDLLVVDDIHEWEGQTAEPFGEVGPLNLAGPQDLSLGLEKKKFICSGCGFMYTPDVEHVCKTTNLTNTIVTSEPLNLKSQPLDLTTGPIYLAMDGSLAQGATYDLLRKHTLNSMKDKSEAFKRCETCGKYLFSNSGYLKHKKQHAGKFRYLCEFCHKGFFDQTNLKTHIDSTHSKLKKYECTHCRKNFFWKHHLKRHNKSCKGAPLPANSEVIALFPSPAATASSLPVISNFLLSIGGQSLRKTKIDKGEPVLQAAQTRSAVQPSANALPAKGTDLNLQLLTAPGFVPDMSRPPAVVSKNPALTYLTLPQTVIIQLQNVLRLPRPPPPMETSYAQSFASSFLNSTATLPRQE